MVICDELGLVQNFELLDVLLVLVVGVPDNVQAVGGPGPDPQHVDVVHGLDHAGAGGALLLVSAAQLSGTGGGHAGDQGVISGHQPALEK